VKFVPKKDEAKKDGVFDSCPLLLDIALTCNRLGRRKHGEAPPIPKARTGVPPRQRQRPTWKSELWKPLQLETSFVMKIMTRKLYGPSTIKTGFVDSTGEAFVDPSGEKKTPTEPATTDSNFVPVAPRHVLAPLATQYGMFNALAVCQPQSSLGILM
jgi:hypothetical protein